PIVPALPEVPSHEQALAAQSQDMVQASPSSASRARRAGRQTLDSCSVLGVSPDDSLNHIQQQYRRTARENHPDKGGDQDAFVKLQAAKDYMAARQSAEDAGAGSQKEGKPLCQCQSIAPLPVGSPAGSDSLSRSAALSIACEPRSPYSPPSELDVGGANEEFQIMRPEASNDAHPTSQAQDGDQDHVSMEEEAMWGALPEKPAPQSVPSSRLSRTGVGQPDPVQRDECWYPSELATASPALPLDSLESTRSANAAGNQELALPSSEPRARRSLATPSGVGARARRATELPPPPQEVFAQLERSAQVRQLPPAPDGPSRSSSVEQLVHSDGMQPGTRRSRR
ncbi:unnamed protein product, partial [Effrenium voratum]